MKKLMCVLLVMALVLTGSLVSYAAESSEDVDLSDYYDNTMTPNDFFQFGRDNQYIYGGKENMTCQDVIDYCDGYGLSGAAVYNSNGSLASPSARLCTGMKVYYLHGQTRYISVYGDANCDGYVNDLDYNAIMNIVMSSKDGSINSPESKSADIDFNGYIDTLDLTAFKNFCTYGLGKAVFAVSYEFSLPADTEYNVFNKPSIAENVRKMGYNKGSTSFTQEVYSEDIKLINGISSSDIFNFVGHGDRDGGVGYIKFYDNVRLTTEEIKYYPENCFAGCRFAYFNTCWAAYGGVNADNPLHAIFNKGVRTVIGYNGRADFNACHTWAEKFYDYCAWGHTVQQAAFEANYFVNNLGDPWFLNVGMLEIFGDKNQRLAQPLGAASGIEPFSDFITPDDFGAGMCKKVDEDNYKGFYDLSALNINGVRTFTTEIARQEIAENALSEYIDLDKYTLVSEIYSPGTEVSILSYSKLKNGIPTSDAGYVFLNQNGGVVAVKVSNNGVFDNITLPAISDEEINAYVSAQNPESEMDEYTYCLNSAGEPVLSIKITTENSVDYIEMPLN